MDLWKVMLVTVTMFAASWIGCNENDGAGGGDSDADTDGDTDTDADGDSDTDAECGWEVMLDPSDEETPGFLSVWGVSENDVFAIGGVSWGEVGMVRYDGQEWNSMDPPTMDNFSIHGLWGTGGSNVIAVGTVSDSSLRGYIIRFDGNEWADMEIPIVDELFGVWGSGASDVWAVGEQNTILYYDGDTWELTEHPDWYQYDYADVWGTSADNVYILGREDVSLDCVILHYDGTEWNEMPVDPTWSGYEHIWGSSPDSIYATTEGGSNCVIRFDGVGWETFAACNEIDDLHNIRDVWGTTNNNFYLVDQDEVWHYSSESWEAMSQPDFDYSFKLQGRAIWGTSETDIFVVGEGIWHYGCS